MVEFFNNFIRDYHYMAIPAALLTIMLHEIAHGYVAYLLGDPTAKIQGRFSLNPLRHIDWIGLLMLIIFKLGWAKPVRVDIRYFKKPKRDFALTALAGPIMNFVISFLSIFILFLLSVTGVHLEALNVFLTNLTVISIGLGLFNLIPIPPLDGSRIVAMFLPDRIYYSILRYERYGFVLLILILYSGVLSGTYNFLLSRFLFMLIQFWGFFFGNNAMLTVFFQFFS